MKNNEINKYQLGNLFQGILSGQGSNFNSIVNSLGNIGNNKTNTVDTSKLNAEELKAINEGTATEEQINTWISEGKLSAQQATELTNKSKMNLGMGLANSMATFSELNADGNIDTTDLGQTAGDFISGSSQYGQIGKQIGNIATNIIGQDRTTNTLGEGVQSQKAGITAMNKALEYTAAGAEYGGLPGAAIGAVAGTAIGLAQGNKARQEAEEEFLKRRRERLDRFNDYSKNQYLDQYTNQMLYAKDGGIYIKESNKGKFTEYCKRSGYSKVTEDCINRAKKSKNSKLRKRAVFAENVRKWN